MKRGRNQRRRQGPNINRALDSNGPDVRIRGTANQIYDKYQNLARDAASAGDRVKAESYLQHAEHYFRLIKSMQPQQAPQPNANGQADTAQHDPAGGDQPDVDDTESGNELAASPDDDDRSGDEESKSNNEPAPKSRPRRKRRTSQSSEAGDSTAKAEEPADASGADPSGDGDTARSEKPGRRPRRKRTEETETAEAV